MSPWRDFKHVPSRWLTAGIVRTLPSGNGALLLQAIMSGSCIRRTKEMQDDDGNRLVVLPPVNFYSIKVDLHEDDRKAYDLAMAASKRKFEEFMRNERTGNVSRCESSQSERLC